MVEFVSGMIVAFMLMLAWKFIFADLVMGLFGPPKVKPRK